MCVCGCVLRHDFSSCVSHAFEGSFTASPLIRCCGWSLCNMKMHARIVLRLSLYVAELVGTKTFVQDAGFILVEAGRFGRPFFFLLKKRLQITRGGSCPCPWRPEAPQRVGIRVCIRVGVMGTGLGPGWSGPTFNDVTSEAFAKPRFATRIQLDEGVWRLGPS